MKGTCKSKISCKILKNYTNSTFITFDVKSLHTSIPHDLGIEAVSYWVNRFPDYLIDQRFDVDFIADGLRIILENNIFKFDDVFYRQLTGTAMGTKVAVIYAILRMNFLELKLYSILPQYYPKDYVMYIYQWWKRFLDDCWLIWKDEFDLNVFFLNVINDLHPAIHMRKTNVRCRF